MTEPPKEPNDVFRIEHDRYCAEHKRTILDATSCLPIVVLELVAAFAILDKVGVIEDAFTPSADQNSWDISWGPLSEDDSRFSGPHHTLRVVAPLGSDRPPWPVAESVSGRSYAAIEYHVVHSLDRLTDVWQSLEFPDNWDHIILMRHILADVIRAKFRTLLPPAN